MPAVGSPQIYGRRPNALYFDFVVFEGLSKYVCCEVMRPAANSHGSEIARGLLSAPAVGAGRLLFIFGVPAAFWDCLYFALWRFDGRK